MRRNARSDIEPSVITCDCGHGCGLAFYTYAMISVVGKQAKANGWRYRRSVEGPHWFAPGHFADWEYRTVTCVCGQCGASYTSPELPGRFRLSLGRQGWTHAPDKRWRAPGCTIEVTALVASSSPGSEASSGSIVADARSAPGR